MPVNHYPKLFQMTEKFDKIMEIALAEAQTAAQAGEVPVGAVLLSDKGDILSRARNRTIELSDPTAHAEILCLREAAAAIGNYRLTGTTLVVTLEPCPMCMGALVHARIATLVFGAADPKWGAAGSLYDLSNDSRLNHHIFVVSGILENKCRELMQDFFRSRRKTS
jgi:tRNA(adenine34) deaminase